jgi:hypothetical protein
MIYPPYIHQPWHDQGRCTTLSVHSRSLFNFHCSILMLGCFFLLLDLWSHPWVSMGIRTRLELRLASRPWQYRDVSLLYPSLRAHSISYCIHRQSTRQVAYPRAYRKSAVFASLECSFHLPSGDCSNNGCPCVLDHGSSIYVALVPHPCTHGLIHLLFWDGSDWFGCIGGS